MSHVEVESLASSIVAAVRAASREIESGAIVTLDDAGVRVHLLPVA